MKYPISIALVAISLGFVQCASEEKDEDRMNSPAPADQQQVVNEPATPSPSEAAAIEERDIASSELRGLRDDVEERIKDVDNRLQRTDLTAQTRKAVEDERTALLGLRERIDRSTGGGRGIRRRATWVRASRRA